MSRHFTTNYLKFIINQGKLFILYFILITHSFEVYAQKQANILYFGSACIDFSKNPPQSMISSSMNSSEAAASICDSNGVLQFYSNGGSLPLGPVDGAIWNRNNEIMENGVLYDTAGCYSSYRGALIIAKPNKSNLYYLITRDCNEHNYLNTNPDNRGLTYSVIDMNLNNGLGKVIQKGERLVYFGKSLSGNGIKKTLNQLALLYMKIIMIIGYFHT